MSKGFWEKLPRPIVGLSPMDGVTDAPMRFIAKKYGGPDVIYTEFVSVDGLWRVEKRGETTHKIWNELKFDDSEHPIVAQLFGSDPDSFYEATKIVAKMGFDGIDINMGCPSPGLEKRGGGAGLMKDKGLAHRVIEAVRKGVEDYFLGSKCTKDVLDLRPSSTSADPLRATFVGTSAPDKNNHFIPVSVKTRIGSSTPDPEWWKFLAGEGLPCVAMHGRTFKQLYSGKADWEALKEAAKIIKESGALFLGNGDVEKISIADNGSECEKSVLDTSPEYRAVPFRANFSGTPTPVTIDYLDGVLIGRAAIGNPWTLRRDGYEPSVEEKLKVAVEHARKFEEVFLPARTVLAGGGRFEVMRKHLTWYAHGFPGAGGLRRKLVVSNSADEVEEIVGEFIDTAKN
ncbi:tRNA-dihydrouridine synthase [bacterium]|nr:MAG: tRNA-dihydrouridine synthase [bacterium]